MNTLKKSDYERLLLLQEFVSSYFSKKITIKEMPYNVESILDSLENINLEDRKSLFYEWTVLEEIYAYMLFQEREELTDKEKALFEEALKKISSLSSKTSSVS